MVDALPLRNPQSRKALLEFVECLQQCKRPLLEVDAILLRCLSVLDGHLVGASSLVTCYLAQKANVRDSPGRFRRCVEDFLRYGGVGDRHVRQAIVLTEERFNDPRLRQQAVATAVGLSAAGFAAKFKTCTGITFTEYLRNMRLARAVALLIGSTKSIKEIWSEIGYNHPSNFDHDFKRRFHTTPSKYRAQAIAVHTDADEFEECLPTTGTRTTRTVLIVDDDRSSRETIGRYLKLVGYSVARASTGREGLLEAARISPQAILLDYHLPDIDGLTWLRKFRHERAATGANVVLFTADWELEVSDRELRELGAKLASKLCDLEEIQSLLADPATWQRHGLLNL